MPHGRLGNATERAVARALLEAGWLVVDKLGGTAISAGFPDFWLYHPELGGQWAEVKKFGDKLTAPQHDRLSRWHLAGCPAWVVTDRDDPAAVLRGPPNLAPWLARGPKKRRIRARYWVDAKRRARLDS
jgi:hypothetical protein